MSNRLAKEQSQYLLQHAHNPVDWYPWGDEAFELAKAQDKPVIVSIGYSACHWCHVMERESFENEETAAYMNAHFVCIKVDREEHPDVDHMYMDAVQAISGNGGWPLNVFVTPDRIPFYGGTYYPPRPAYNKPSWLQLMQRMNEVWVHQQDEVTLQAQQMIQHLQQAAKTVTAKTGLVWNHEVSDKIAHSLLQQADKEKGGFGNAPKFPGTMAISYLLEHYHFTGHRPSLDQALLSLDKMADGGIYDQLGGGFARYSTDREWLAPHFEKMLYDNALLVLSYCDAYTLTKDERYRTIVDETIAFAERELKDKSGLYYCALDADSEGVEGKFYTFTWEEWNEALGSAEPAVAAYFGVTEHGNWEETNILHLGREIAPIAAHYELSVTDLEWRIEIAKVKLLAYRNGRIRPLTDDKCLLSWNALMSIALTKAAATFSNAAYKAAAVQHMEVMLTRFDTPTGYAHTWNKGIARISAKLDDLAYLAQAMLQLASLTGVQQLVVKAAAITEVVISDFGHDNGYFYFTSIHQTDIPLRKIDLYDGATPSANAVMAHNLWITGMLTERSEWIERSGVMLRNIAETASRYSYSFGYWAQLIQRNIKGMKTVVLAGKDSDKVSPDLKIQFFPHVFSLFSTGNEVEIALLENKFSEGKLHIFVCSEESCYSPVSSSEQAIKLINDL